MMPSIEKKSALHGWLLTQTSFSFPSATLTMAPQRNGGRIQAGYSDHNN